MQRKVSSAIANITLNRATFSNVPINELTFVNFFYGNNGAGKSSIAYAIEEGGICWCAIEKAWTQGKSSFRKPVSCHLYPIRISKYGDFEALNYNKWHICRCAREKGSREQVPLYRFLREALIARYGEAWYSQLEEVAHEIETGKLEIPPEYR